jgi:hypothetical protein
MDNTQDDFDHLMQYVIESSRKRRQKMLEFWRNHPGNLASEAGDTLHPEYALSNSGADAG